MECEERKRFISLLCLEFSVLYLEQFVVFRIPHLSKRKLHVFILFEYLSKGIREFREQYDLET